MDPWHPQDPGLSKYHRNSLFRAIEASRVPVTEFKLAVRNNIYRRGPHEPCIPVTLIRHEISKSFFGIVKLPTGGDAFNTRQQIGGMRTERQEFDWNANRYQLRERGHDWQSVLDGVKAWIKGTEQFLVRAEEYARTPDLWDELYQTRKYFVGQQKQSFEDTPFTLAEQAQVSSQLKQITAYIKTTHKLTREQISPVEATLNHAAEASSRMGRKDWLMLFYGAVSSLVLADLIPPQTAQHVFLLTIHALSHLFGFGVPPQHLPPGG
jgi:hypothetical protein